VGNFSITVIIVFFLLIEIFLILDRRDLVIMKIFDAHAHCFPDHIAENTLKYLSSLSGISASFDGTVLGLQNSMKLAGITASLNCPIATSVKQVNSINDWSFEINNYPLFSMGTIHPDSDNPETILQGIVDNGLLGIKMHPEYQRFSPLEKRVQPIWEVCAMLKIPVLLHTGSDIGFKPPYHTNPLELKQFLHNHPNLIVIAAHFGSMDMWEEVEEILCGENIYLDLAYTSNIIDEDLLRRVAQKHDKEKILFATDAPWKDQSEDLKWFMKLGFNEKEKEDILWNNSNRLFNLEEKIECNNDLG